MLNNPVKPQAHKIIDILKQTDAEWTFRVENELPIRHGQFMQLSLPKIGEAPSPSAVLATDTPILQSERSER